MPYSKRLLTVNDHSHFSYVKMLPDKRGVTTADFVKRVLPTFAR